ncbi:MAG: flagellar filament capping protein FliD [Rickettsiales bacterium]|nr:flagellar filament capping protein FliD [Rickettsiales bacterium]
MISSIQLGNIFTSGDKTLVSGGSTGFDIEALVGGLTDIKRLPAVQLETQLETNALRQTAFGELRTIISNYSDAANLLRNPPGVNNAEANIFEYRNSNLSTNDGTDASTYLSVTAAPGAALSSYDITVDSVASYSTKTTETFALADLDTVAVGGGLPFNAGTLTLGPNEIDITIDAGDTLAQILTKINAVEDDSGVRATALQVSDGNYRLQFKTIETGADQNYSFFGVHAQVGNEVVIEAEDFITNISRSGDTFTSGGAAGASGGQYYSAQTSDGDIYLANIETTAPEMVFEVEFDAPGRYYIHGRARGGSANDSFHVGLNGVAPTSAQGFTLYNNATFEYSNIAQGAGGPGYIDVTEAGQQTVSIYAREDGTAIDQLVLSTDGAYAPAGVEASTRVAKNTGILNIGFAIQEDADDAQLTIDGTTITRSTNNIDDLIEDVTFNLNQATPLNTEVSVEIEPDTEIVSAAITNFVDTYNSLRVFASKQNEVDGNGNFVEGAVLNNSPTMRSLVNNILNELSSVVSGLTVEPNKLADLGITLDDFQGDDETPFTRNILVLDPAKLENALVADFDAVRDVFEFNFVSDNTEVQVFSRTNSLEVTDFELDIDITNGVYEARTDLGVLITTLEAEPIIGGGLLLKGLVGTELEGLELIFGGTADTTATIGLSQGIGDRIFNILDAALDADEGIIQTELDSIADSNDRLNEDIARIDEIVERFRLQQLERFASLEALISSVNTILQSLDASAAAAANS